MGAGGPVVSMIPDISGSNKSGISRSHKIIDRLVLFEICDLETKLGLASINTFVGGPRLPQVF